MVYFQSFTLHFGSNFALNVCWSEQNIILKIFRGEWYSVVLLMILLLLPYNNTFFNISDNTTILLQHNKLHTYRVDRTLDSNGQNWTDIFFTVFRITAAFRGAAMFFLWIVNSDLFRRAEPCLFLPPEGARGP